MMARDQRVEELLLTMQTMFRSWKGYFSRILGPEKISPVQLGLLMFLESHGQTSGRTISAALQLSPSAVTQLLESLNASGYISREVSETDRRVTFFGLSKAGHAKLRAVEDKNRQLLKDATATLSDHEIETMVAIQQKIITQIETINRTKE